MDHCNSYNNTIRFAYEFIVYDATRIDLGEKRH